MLLKEIMDLVPVLLALYVLTQGAVSASYTLSRHMAKKRLKMVRITYNVPGTTSIIRKTAIG